MKNKNIILIFFCFFLLKSNKVFSNNFKIKYHNAHKHQKWVANIQIGKIVYGTHSMDKDSTLKKNIATMCNNYLYKHKKNLPFLFYIVFSDTLTLAYDNLQGNYIRHKQTYSEGEMKEMPIYSQAGIRINLPLNSSREDILKIVDFCIFNVKLLQRNTFKFFKEDYYDSPISIDRVIIDKILQKKIKKRIRSFLCCQ